MNNSFFENVGIEEMAFVYPPEVCSSKDIEEKLTPLYKKLNLSSGRLELMTGIKERRFWPSEYRPSKASAEAGKSRTMKNATIE